VSLLRAVLDEIERDPELVERLRRLLGAQSVAAPSGPAAMRIADYARHTGVSVRHVHALVRRGLPCLGSGRTRRVDVARALAWMRDESTSPAPARGATPAPESDPELAEVAELAAERAKRRRKAAVR
jgi:hypothetical protein